MPSAVAALKKASKGLLYPSESDASFEVFTWKNLGGTLTHEKLLTLAGRDPECPVEVTTTDDFFAELTAYKDDHSPEEKAVVQGYRTLRQAVKEHLIDAKTFRVGEIEVAVYLVGKTPEGDWVGLKTLSVET